MRGRECGVGVGMVGGTMKNEWSTSGRELYRECKQRIFVIILPMDGDDRIADCIGPDELRILRDDMD